MCDLNRMLEMVTEGEVEEKLQEGDLKTCLAMKICDLLGVGGSFCEIVVTDYEDGTILLGHDGPFHLAIADGKPMLRGLGVYHGKQGSGKSLLKQGGRCN